MSNIPLNYDPKKLSRENLPYYIGATENEIQEMLASLGLKSLDDLYAHIPAEVKMNKVLMSEGMNYEQLLDHVNQLSKKNKSSTSFIGDGLPHYKTTDVVGPVCSIRGLTTAYTPYQPERSQGTLQTLWIYQSLISMLTGFEAINASLYDRSTCLFEAMNCALRLVKDSNTILVSNSLYPGDIEVLKTHAIETGMNLEFVDLDLHSGTINLAALENKLKNISGIAAVAFPQNNCLGLLENVDTLTDLCNQYKVKSIAVVDPMLIGAGGLKPPVQFGSQKQGADMVVAEGQHLAIAANFGGPGLGIFGIRYNENDKNSIRSTAGRFVGKTVDLKGRECKALILSTREQHIRREKATSNICSNQSFVASLAGACLLARGDAGMKATLELSRKNAQKVCELITSYEGFDLKFKNQICFNEILIETKTSAQEILKKANEAGLQLGVDVSKRLNQNDHLLLLSLTDLHTDEDFKKLESFLNTHFKKTKTGTGLPEIPTQLKRSNDPGIPQINSKDIIEYYQKLGKQNLSPDDGIYPLGSCTMKYNPYINDYAASLPGFTNVHPEAPETDAQGCLEVLYEIQEMFKAITGLPALTTQPVAGAQGELVGLKLFQAYHRDRGENQTRRVIVIPRSAHGTNPATATMAGYDLHVIPANTHGEMDLEALKDYLKDNASKVAGVMVTNPNTAGVFETQFKKMSQMIHEAGGLVYMDGANMNAIAGILDLNKLGVDAVHNNLHKTWTIPHGGGGPGDAIVAVSQKLIDYLPGVQVIKTAHGFETIKSKKSIGSFHRHFGNFAHKIRAYTYLKALGGEGVRKMSAVSVLCARYLHHKLSQTYPTLPVGAEQTPRMHEFILTLSNDTFKKIEEAGTPKANTIARIGKLFLDFGFHAPTVAFPEQFGLMIEPTETYSKKELDQFADVVSTIFKLIHQHPEVLKTVPHFTPIDRVDEVGANKNPVLSEKITKDLPQILPDRVDAAKLRTSTAADICQMIVEAHKKSSL